MRNATTSPSCRKALILSLLLAVMFMCSCGGGTRPSPAKPEPPPAPPQPPAPVTTAVCAAPATQNPPGGGGTAAQIQIDPNVYGHADISNLTVFGFSQVLLTDQPDPQVLELAPDIVSRAWQRWDRWGLLATDYNFGYPAQARKAGIIFIGGTTASVLFPDEFSTREEVASVASCNVQGQPVSHSWLSGAYRGSLASPKYRQYLIDIGKVQIDGGVDGLFFDEIDTSYQGPDYQGNEGYDDADVADFGGFLCAKYPSLIVSDWNSRFAITSADKLDCSLSADKRGRSFDYRGYLVRHGWQTTPLNSANPLATEWGSVFSGHPNLSAGTFVETYPSLVYWQDIVLTLRQYARQRYGKEIYITANGIFPFVDFQMNGLWEPNPDGPDGTSVDYAPVTPDGRFDGTKSLLSTFMSLKQRSLKTAGRAVPFALFIDWPTTVMTRYLAMPQQDRRDYFRMYTAEAYAAGVFFNLHLADTIGDPTAAQLGMMPLFDQLAAFYKSHRRLYQQPVDLPGTVTVSVPNVTTNLTQLGDGTRIAHVINHNYSHGFVPQTGLTVAFQMASAPTTVTLISPDLASDTAAAFTFANGTLQVAVPRVDAYVAVVAR